MQNQGLRDTNYLATVSMERPMMNEISDEELAEDMAAQLKIIVAGYEIGTPSAIDNALNHVTQVRRMKSNGILDLLASSPDGDKTN